MVDNLGKTGDKIILFTDGVIEASSYNGNLYSQERFEELIKENSRNNSCDELYNLIMEDIKLFTKQTPQSDDITLMVAEFLG